MDRKLNHYIFEQYRCSYLDTGSYQEKDNVLVMIHNGMMSHQVFEHQIQFFKNSYRVIAVDLLGYGSSEKPELTYSSEIYVQQLSTLITHLGLKTFDLMGCCIGGAVAMEYCYEYPEHVKRLIVATANVPDIVDKGVFGEMNVKAPVGSYWHKLGRSFFKTWVGKNIFKLMMRKNQMGKYWGKEKAWDKTVNTYFADTKNVNTFCSFDVNKTKYNLSKRPINFPQTMVLWGGKNKILPADAAASWAKAFGVEKLTIYPQQGYMLLREAAEKVNRDIDNFLADGI